MLTLSKGRLIKIDWKEHTEAIKEIWETPQNYRSGSLVSRMNKIKKLVGYGSGLVGHCSRCKELNTHILKQKVDGAILITRFCQEHVPV